MLFDFVYRGCYFVICVRLPSSSLQRGTNAYVPWGQWYETINAYLIQPRVLALDDPRTEFFISRCKFLCKALKRYDRFMKEVKPIGNGFHVFTSFIICCVISSRILNRSMHIDS